MKAFEGQAGVYVHTFNSTSSTIVYVGQAGNLAQRPATSLIELITAGFKNTAGKAGASYSGSSQFIRFEGSGFSSLNALENAVLESFGGTMKPRGCNF
jgi:hypothetical protein